MCIGQKTNSFTLLKNGNVPAIFVSKSEAPQIIRAVSDLQKDIEMVTGTKPTIVNTLNGVGSNVIIIGSIKDATINKLIEKGTLDEAKGIEKLKQAFLLKSIVNYNKNIKNALAIVGSDILGTVYGIYDLSERIGVSPMY